MNQYCNHLKESVIQNNLVSVSIRKFDSGWTLLTKDYEEDEGLFYIRYCPLCGQDLYELEEEPN